MKRRKKVRNCQNSNCKPLTYRLLAGNRRFLFVFLIMMVTGTVLVIFTVVIALMFLFTRMLAALSVRMAVVVVFGPMITIQNGNHWNDHRFSAGSIKEQLLQSTDNCPVQRPLVNYLVILEGIQNCPEDLMISGLNQLLGFVHVDKSPRNNVRASHNLIVLEIHHGNGGYDPFFGKQPPLANLWITNGVTGIPAINVDVCDAVNMISQTAGVLGQGQNIPVFENETVFLWHPSHLCQLSVDLLHPVLAMDWGEELWLHQP